MLIFFLCLYAYCTVVAVMTDRQLSAWAPMTFWKILITGVLVFAKWPFFVKRMYKEWQTAKNSL